MSFGERDPWYAYPERQKTYTQAELDAAVAAERERCAAIAEQTVCDTHLPTGVRIYGSAAAKAIRAQ